MLKGIIFSIIGLFTLIFLTVLTVYLYYLKRAKKIDNKLKNIKIINKNKFNDFNILNPYHYSGKYYKAQLHAHSNKSDGKMSIESLVKCYKYKGYNFLAVTDHDKITKIDKYNDSNFITIPGEELTIIEPFWPFGRHMNRLFVDSHYGRVKTNQIDNILKNSGINVINHPVTISGLATQRWDIDNLLEYKYIKFIEIYNHFSDEKSNIKYWHLLLNKYGNSKPIWSLAVDDTHTREDIDQAWIMVKVENIDKSSLLRALSRGSFYSTQGPEAEFDVKSNEIFVLTDSNYEIKFINAENNIIKIEKNKKSSYKPDGNEGFIRIEIVDKNNNNKLWSQPFWLINN